MAPWLSGSAGAGALAVEAVEGAAGVTNRVGMPGDFRFHGFPVGEGGDVCNFYVRHC